MSQPALGAPFDAYERHRLTARIVDHLFGPERRPVHVLDVGGHSSLLKQLMPEDRIVVADVEPPPPFAYRPGIEFRPDAYVRASGGALPFADGSFDLVAAHDTLEHVPEEARRDFLQELTRASRGYVVLNGPIHRPETARAERRLEAFWRLGLGVENPALIEHLDNQLPRRELIESVLDGVGLPFVSIPNGNLLVWLSMMALKFYFEILPEGSAVHEALDRSFNSMWADADLAGVCYREAFVVAVKPSGEARFAGLRDSVTSTESGLGADRTSPLFPLMDALQSHSSRLRTERESVEERLAAALRERERAVAGSVDRDAMVLGLRQRERELEEQVRALDKELVRVTGGGMSRLIHRSVRFLNRVAPWGTRRRSLLLAPARAVRMAMERGVGATAFHLLKVWVWIPRLWKRAWPQDSALGGDERYELWLRWNVLSRRSLNEMRRELRDLRYRPLISVIMPTYNTDPAWLRAAIRSLRDQVYDRWELCIADDASAKESTLRALRRLAGRDARIKVRFLERNVGISGASNAALELADGEFVALLDHDDELKPNALSEVVRRLNQDRDLDFIYSDEDKRAPDGRLIDPFFKPDWSPDFLMSANYVTHLSVFRRSVLDEVGGFRLGYEGSQDYDLVLRVTEVTDRIGHISAPLYTWRQVPGSAAASTSAKPFAYSAAKRALQEALDRRGLQGTVEDGHDWGYYRVRYSPTGVPRVGIVIPARDRVDVLRRCVESIWDRSTYPNHELIVVDNRSTSPEMTRFLEDLPARVVRDSGEFNLARMLNAGAREAGTEILLFVHDDVEVIDPGWIEALLEHVTRPEIAAAGGRLLHLDGRPQHEGMVIGPRGGLAENVAGVGYFGIDRCVRNVAAVNAACLMTRTDVLGDLGGFEERFRVTLADADYCLRALEKGYRVVYTPYASAYHEQAGRHWRIPDVPREEDRQLFRRRWSGFRDPCYNPNLDPDEAYALRLDLVDGATVGLREPR
ncbi:MAG TPA: glycosyltransferase [Actinomycetota bacterium]|nr:glycosyltransferase [Actinomycetota bacterium]